MRSLFCGILIFVSLQISAQVDALVRNTTRPRTMSQRWELDSTSTKGTFLVTPYKPIYLIPFRYSSKPNDLPSSGNTNPNYDLTQPNDYNNIELKFQISFKTKLLQGIFWKHADLWAAYTQVSDWQVYNTRSSRPFRESNYEPELILNFPVKFHVFGFNARMASVGLNHQSNGKGLPYSRSWNRVMFQLGLEREHWSIYLRPWIRLKDTPSDDDNPDISEYVGRGEFNLIYATDGHVLSLIGTHNLSFGTAIKGGLQFSWSFPVKGNLRGFVQATHGYGETLIDYNHRQSTVGIGVSLVEWL